MPITQQVSLSRPLQTYANQPPQAQFARQLLVRRYLEQKLPGYIWSPLPLKLALESLP